MSLSIEVKPALTLDLWITCFEVHPPSYQQFIPHQAHFQPQIQVRAPLQLVKAPSSISHKN